VDFGAVQPFPADQLLCNRVNCGPDIRNLQRFQQAERMQTSRRALDRLLDPKNTGVTLHTMQRAAAAIGRQLRLELV
jgi:hypothetical protein